MSTGVLIVCLCFATICIFVDGGIDNAEFNLGRRSSAKVDKLSSTCPNMRKKLAWEIIYDNITSIGHFLVANITLVTRRTVTHNIGMRVTLKKCKYEDNPDTCETMIPFTMDKWCEAASGTKVDILQNFFISLHPPMVCPVKKGTYRTINFTQDLYPLLLFESESFFWVHRYEIFDIETEEILLCTTGQSSIRRRV